MGFENGRLVRVVLSASFGGGANKQVNVLHYDLKDSSYPLHDNDPQQLADDFRDDVIPAYAALFDSGWTIFPVVVQEELDPKNLDATRDGWTSGSATPGTRTGVGEILPVQACPVATLHTGHIGRRARGRMFLCGPISEGDQNAGVISSTGLTRYQAFLDAIPRQPDLATGVSSSTADWSVYSRTQRNTPAGTGYANAITDVVLHSDVHWLRSRGQ